MHILYIDDDPEDREIFKEAIATIDSGYVCNLANDGKQGFQALEEMVVMPDVIFVDINMPVMTGKQFLGAIKEIPRLRSIPVVMYSTTSHKNERQQLIDMGAYHVLAKGNTFQNICELLASIIKPRCGVSF